MRRVSPYRFHPEAWSELEAADDWYLSHNFDASLAFLSEVEAALEQICEAPQRWPERDGL